jgi:hypothetical protein
MIEQQREVTVRQPQEEAFDFFIDFSEVVAFDRPTERMRRGHRRRRSRP